MEFIFRIRGLSPENRQTKEQKEPNSTASVNQNSQKGKDNERVQEYHSSQQGRKQVKGLNIEIYNRFFTTLGRLGQPRDKNFNKTTMNRGSTINQTQKTIGVM